ALDTSFGTGGTVTTDFGGNALGAWGLSLSGTTLTLGGEAFNGSNYDFALARYNTTTGMLDSSFWTGGTITTDFAGKDADALGMTVQSEGKLVLSGYTTNIAGNWDFAVARYTTSGALDTSFNASGKLAAQFGSYDYGHGVAIQSADGKIIVAGGAESVD